jgi:transcriptional regulator with XRE-family HTH domain
VSRAGHFVAPMQLMWYSHVLLLAVNIICDSGPRAPEPTEGEPLPDPDYQLVRERLVQTRRRQNVTLRQAAQRTGISAATLSRFERGAGNPDLPTIDKLISWLELDRAAVFAPSGRGKARPANTPDQVAVLLRADPKLDRGTAQALSRLFKSAYSEFSKIDPDG